MTVTEMDAKTLTGDDAEALATRLAAVESRLQQLEAAQPEDKVAIVVFSGDLDKVLASFVIATGAAALGQEVSMFFTFWGLGAIKRKSVLDVMGISEEELIPGLEPAGVAAFLSESLRSRTNLFI